MEFLNSPFGLGILLYLVVGMLIIKNIERKDNVNFALITFIMCTITWLPIVLRGIFAGFKGEK